MKYPNGALTSVAEAAARLSVGRKSITRHLPTTRIGRRVLVRVSDVEAKIAEGQSDAS
ncbi:helix-turn-helix domain-containing protein [Methylobacterium sp. WL122]|nr:helix-turn-helix domain-containing protein [Methylobacterium sp. WL122]